VDIQICNSLLRGLENRNVETLGAVIGTVLVDGNEAEKLFLVVSNQNMENDVFLGFDFVSKFRVSLNEGLFTLQKSSAQPFRAKKKS